ncbi:collagenase [Spirochaetia bacterium]|nr:collagenase [Spirochaetia bacterium]
MYFGIENLNMRARSSANFSLDDLPRIVSTCKGYGLKSYLTLNTIIYDGDLPLMRRIVDASKVCGVSAVIACDMSVIEYAHNAGMPVHISTQANVSNSEAVRFYSRYANVVVLARELNLFQVKEIYDYIRTNNICAPDKELVQIEMFCHGALCMAIAGKCYLSLHASGASANKGACYQLCRRSYSARDNETGFGLSLESNYIMSPKDLCTIEFLPAMLDAGVRIFKIEGRARPAEYVKKTCECYDRAFKAIEAGAYDGRLTAALLEELRTVFNRGFWSGYYQGAEIGQWSNVYGSQATRTKTYVARATHYFSKIGVGEFLIEAGAVKNGDNVMVTGAKTGVAEFAVEGIRIGGEAMPAGRACKGQIITIPVPCKIRLSDKMYIWGENKNVKRNENENVKNEKTLPV